MYQNNQPTARVFPLINFIWNKEDKTLSQEASSLGFKAGEFPETIVIEGKEKTISFGMYKNEYSKGEDVELEKVIYCPSIFAVSPIDRVIIFND